MNFDNFDFKNNYNNFLEFLYSKRDTKYLEFHSKLLKDKTNLIGIRVPILKEIAKKISKGDYLSFFQNNTHNTYEEKMIHGLVIGYLNISFKELLKELDLFIPYVDNWAINDVVCANLKAFKKYPKEGYTYIQKLLKDKNSWYIRFGLVLLLDFYINEDYIDNILDIANNIKSTDYYVQMANAWLISICFIKFEEKTYQFLLNNELDDFTFNKSISKICDSYRVEKLVKEELRKLRR